MALVRALAITPLLLALHLLAGCATTENRTMAVADRLQDVADAFAAHPCDESNVVCSGASYLQIAHGFSDDAHEFRRTLDAGVSARDIVLEYERLWRRYHKLDYEVARSRDRSLQAEWRSVTAAFVDVREHVRARYSYADPDLYARGGYVHDPYYN